MMRYFVLIVTSFVFFNACAAPTATNNANITMTTNPIESPSSSPAAISQAVSGSEIYALNCMICHKDTGKGGKSTINGKNIQAEDLTEDKLKKATDEKLIGYVTNGIEDEGMPAFKDKLTADDIKAVVAHIRTLQQK